MCEREKGKWEKVEDLEEDTPKRETRVEIAAVVIIVNGMEV